MPECHEDTTTTLKRIAPGFAWLPRVLREHLTPRAVWTAVAGIWTLLVALSSAGLTVYMHSAVQEKDILQLKEGVKKFDDQASALQGISTQLAVLDSKVDNISHEVDHQREWRERIEQQAEAPPHARWRRK